MTYPLHQRTFHEFLYYLHNARVHCCVGRAAKHYRWQLIKSIISGIYVMNQRERIHLASNEVVWHFSGPPPLAASLPAPRCLFLSLTVSVGFIAKPHRNFQKAHVAFFFVSRHLYTPSMRPPRSPESFLTHRMTNNSKHDKTSLWPHFPSLGFNSEIMKRASYKT